MHVIYTYQRSHIPIHRWIVASVSISINKITEIFANIAIHANTTNIYYNNTSTYLSIQLTGLLTTQTHSKFSAFHLQLTFNKTYIDCQLYSVLCSTLALYCPVLVFVLRFFFCVRKLSHYFKLILLIATFVCVCLCKLDLMLLEFLNNLIWICAAESRVVYHTHSRSHSHSHLLAYSFIKLHGLASVILLINNQTFLLLISVNFISDLFFN